MAAPLLLELEIAPETPKEAAFLACLSVLSRELGLPGLARKAVPPHSGHYTPRDPQGRFHETLTIAEPELRTGRGEQAAAKTQAKRRVHEELAPRLLDHLFDYEAGHLGEKEFVRRAHRDLAHYYEMVYNDGKRASGSLGRELTPHETAVLRRLLLDERHYLEKFARDMAEGKGRMPYPTRMRLYATATWEPFWVGWVLGNLDPRREIRWRFGNTVEHCRDCTRFVQMGWTPVETFYRQVIAKGYAPRSGHLDCTGVNCRCSLHDRITGVRGESKWQYPDSPPPDDGAKQTEAPSPSP